MKQQFQAVMERWRSLAPREQYLLAAGAAVVLALVVFLGVIEPMAKTRAQREMALEQSRALAQRLVMIGAEVRASQGRGLVPAARSTSLLAALDQSIKQSTIGKPWTRLQPDGDKQAKVWFDSVPFDALAKWLFDLESRYGVLTQTVDIERDAAAGTVTAQLTLVRP